MRVGVSLTSVTYAAIRKLRELSDKMSHLFLGVMTIGPCLGLSIGSVIISGVSNRDRVCLSSEETK